GPLSMESLPVYFCPGPAKLLPSGIFVVPLGHFLIDELVRGPRVPTNIRQVLGQCARLDVRSTPVTIVRYPRNERVAFAGVGVVDALLLGQRLCHTCRVAPMQRLLRRGVVVVHVQRAVLILGPLRIGEVLAVTEPAVVGVVVGLAVRPARAE